MAIYIGVGGKARKVVGGYVGNMNGKAEIIYGGGDLPSGYVPYTYIYKNSYVAKITNYDSESSTHPSYNTYTQILCDFYIPLWHSGYEYLFYLDSKYWARIGPASGYKFRLDIQKGSGSTFSISDLESGKSYSLNLTKDQDGSCYLNNDLLFKNLDPTITSDRIYILNTSSTPSNSYNYGVRLKGLTGYDLLNKKYLFDFKPCNKTTSGIVSGVYDTINKKFLDGGSSYSTNFVCSNN